MSGQPSRPASAEPLPRCGQSLGRSLWGQSPACSSGGSAMSFPRGHPGQRRMHGESRGCTHTPGHRAFPFLLLSLKKSSTRAFRGHHCVQQHLSGLLLGEAPTCSKCHRFRAKQCGSHQPAGAALHRGLVWSRAPHQPARPPPAATQPQPVPPPRRASRPGRSDSWRGAVPGPQRKSEARAAAGDGGAEAKLPRQMSHLGAARADCAITPLCERGFEMQRQKDLLRSCSAVVV